MSSFMKSHWLVTLEILSFISSLAFGLAHLFVQIHAVRCTPALCESPELRGRAHVSVCRWSQVQFLTFLVQVISYSRTRNTRDLKETALGKIGQRSSETSCTLLVPHCAFSNRDTPRDPFCNQSNHLMLRSVPPFSSTLSTPKAS